MTVSVTIGEFSRLTHLSVKTLHHYHEIGLLAPDRVDPSSGYRRYRTDQVPTALLIRRLRDLDMPLAQVRAVVEAPDPAVRDRALREHLDRMEYELSHTRQVVGSLRSMLTSPYAAPVVERRVIPDQHVLAIADHVPRERIGEWCAASFPALAARARSIAGVAGATYAEEFFTEAAGEVVAFVPVPPDHPEVAGAELIDLPGGDFAVLVHAGPLEEFDRSYAELGGYVAEHFTSLPDPIREMYVVGPDLSTDADQFRTEVCWPIQ